MDVNDLVLWTVTAGIDPYAAWGVEAEHKLTREEWNAFKAAESTEKYMQAAQKEEEYDTSSFDILRKKKLWQEQPLLENRPVYVICGTRSRHWNGVYNAGVAKRNGTEKPRKHVREMIKTIDEKGESLMRNFLRLSTKSKLVFGTASGHFVQLTQPNIIVEGVAWVLENHGNRHLRVIVKKDGWNSLHANVQMKSKR